MAELLELLDTIRAEEASVQRLYQNEGPALRSLRTGPNYMHRLAETAKLIAAVVNGRRPVYHLREAMSTSDFPQLFGDIIDRQVLANYAEAPYSWSAYIRRRLVNDFRSVKRLYVEGGEGTLEAVAQLAPYPHGKLVDGEYTYAVAKYGRVFAFSWETMVNNDLDMLSDVPQRMGRSARRSEERYATSLFVDANGPHASLYSVGNNNLVTGNPALSVAALQAALTKFSKQVDSDGEPIMIEGAVLVVPPALEVTALNIVNALQIELTEAGGTSGQKLITANWVKTRLKVVVNYYIPILASSANGDTSWFIFANPAAGRGSLEMAFLRGHEQPEMFMHIPDQQRIGGGTAGAESFDHDALRYKLRHVFGGGRMDPKGTVASNGSGV